MKRQRVSSSRTSDHRLSSTLCGLALALLGLGASACRDDDSPDTARQVQEASADCTDFQGIKHCALGSAKLTPRGDGAALEITELGSDKDGVSVVLPDVTSFAANGRIDGTAPGSSLHVRALSDGNTIGTMTLQRQPEGYLVSATFTGDGSESMYNVNLYNGDNLVGQIARQSSNGPAIYLPHNERIWWYWWWWWWWPSFWNAQRTNPGECVWSLPLAAGDEVRVVDDSGKPVVADRVELQEIVRRGGSYPYMTFNRIDYTLNGARMVLESENLENTH